MDFYLDDDRKAKEAEKIQDWEKGTLDLLAILKFVSDLDDHSGWLTRREAADIFNKSWSEPIEEGMVPEMTRHRTRTRLEQLYEDGYVKRDRRDRDGAFLYAIDDEDMWRESVAQGVLNAVQTTENSVAVQPILFETFLSSGTLHTIINEFYLIQNQLEARLRKAEARLEKLEKK